MMAERKHKDVATQEFNKTVVTGINKARDYESRGIAVAGKKSLLPTLDGLYAVVYKPSSYVRKGVEVIGKGRGTGREPKIYK